MAQRSKMKWRWSSIGSLPGLRGFLYFLDKLGSLPVRRWQGISYQFAVIWTALILAVQPSSWPRTTRETFVRQLLFTAVDALPFTLRVAMAVGVMAIVQTETWGRRLGDASLLDELMWHTTLRELAPILANLVVIGRSGSAMATEMASMSLSGEVELLDSQGLDPMKYLVMPRILSTAISVFCLCGIIVTVIFFSGYLAATLLDVVTVGPLAFLNQTTQVLGWQDGLFFFLKTFVTGLFIGSICTTEGLRVRGAATELPVVASRTGVRAMTAVFAISALLSIVFYQQLLLIELGGLLPF